MRTTAAATTIAAATEETYSHAQRMGDQTRVWHVFVGNNETAAVQVLK